MKPKTNLVHLVLAAFLAGTGCGDSAAFQGGSGGQPGVGGEPVVGTGGAAGEVGTGGSAVRCPVGFAGDDCDECAPLFQDNDADGTCKLACGDLVQCGSGACDDASGTATCRQCLQTLAMLGSARTPSMAARWFMISGSRSAS